MLSSVTAVLLLAGRLQFVVPDANYSLRDGLPAVQVLSLYQDRSSALWVGTTAGLAELGGPSVRTFDSGDGIAGSSVFAIGEDASGSLIVGTERGLLRRTGDVFEPVTLPGAVTALPIRRFARGPDGSSWALAGDRTILHEIGGQWQMVAINEPRDFEANDFTIDRRGALWIATRNHGLLMLSPSVGELRRSGAFQPKQGSVTAIDHVAAAGDVVYFTSALGLSRLSVISSGMVTTVAFPPGSGVGHRAIAIDAAGRPFIGTNLGVLSLEGGALTSIESGNGRARASTVTLLSDREGQLWMGTREAGVNLLLLGRGVRFLRADREDLRSIDVDRQGVHWVSNERRVLAFRTDGVGAPISPVDVRFEGFDALTIYGTEEDPNGGLLFAMEGGVAFIPRTARDGAAPVARPDPRFALLRDRLVTAIRRDPNDQLWAVSPFGLFRLKKADATAAPVSLPDPNPWMAVIDETGWLWVSTRRGSLMLVDTATGEAVRVPLPKGQHVEAIGSSPRGGIMASFESGDAAFFQRYKGQQNLSFSAGPEGLSKLSVLSLLRIGDSYLVAHDGDKLSQIDAKQGLVEQTILTSADLQDSDFRYLTLREGRPGKVWFTLLNGIGLLDPPIAPPEPGHLRIEPAREAFVIEPRPNSLDLRAELADPVAPRKARYRYRLHGQSEEWSAWSADPRIPLSNVPPGSFRLEVQAEDRYGRQSNAVSVDIEARAHPWESWPSRWLALFGAVSLVYFFYRRRVLAIENERLALAEAVRAGRADLEAANRRLQDLSITDMLTGLRNRRYFTEVVEDEIRILRERHAERVEKNDPNRDALFFLLDLDRFKTVNDLFGHGAGDAVLKESARRLAMLLRKTDRLIRWGGEEFLVVSLDSQRGEAPEIASRILSAISGAPFSIGPEDGLQVTTSIGWAAFPFAADGAEPGPEDVVQVADRGLYRAKRAGRNCAVGILPAGEAPFAGGEQTGTVEVLKDFGIAVTFTMVRGTPPMSGQDLLALRESGAHRRLF